MVQQQLCPRASDPCIEDVCPRASSIPASKNRPAPEGVPQLMASSTPLASPPSLTLSFIAIISSFRGTLCLLLASVTCPFTSLDYPFPLPRPPLWVSTPLRCGIRRCTGHLRRPALSTPAPQPSLLHHIHNNSLGLYRPKL